MRIASLFSPAGRKPSSMPAPTTFADVDALVPFDFDPRTRVVYGSGTADRLGELARELGGLRALVVSDEGVAKAGYVDQAVTRLTEAGIESAVFTNVQPNPTTEDVDRGLVVARESRIDLLVAVGGGSSMDCAKGINFLLTNGGQMRDYWGMGKAQKPMLPLIAIPTTAGTGSEAQSFAIIADADTHVKMACGDKKAACRIAILDPNLTLSMPPGVTAATGIDAISHALESYVTTRRNPVSQLFARRAWRLLAQGFPTVIANGTSHSDSRLLAARGAMLLGAHLAGAAIENSMLGATHALANPLTAHFGITHGLAVGLMLPHVIRFNSPAVGSLYGTLAADAKICLADDARAGELLADQISELLRQSGMPTNLAQCGVERRILPQLAEDAARQWTGTFNPRPVDGSSLLGLYEAAYDPAP
jgi:alcohol dehydrogenase